MASAACGFLFVATSPDTVTIGFTGPVPTVGRFGRVIWSWTRCLMVLCMDVLGE